MNRIRIEMPHDWKHKAYIDKDRYINMYSTSEPCETSFNEDGTLKDNTKGEE